ncbi:MAG: PspC domain-containing protein [Candidatus Metalachnospira sp.]|nr:PspC domain-containing protein [Candidatus Metalachnospira sp.]
MNNKKIVRPMNGRKVSGVCLGFSDYLGTDVTIIRILWVLLTIFLFGTGIILYIACIFIIPEEEDGTIEGDFKEK